MPRTFAFTTDAADPDEPIMAHEFCSLIIIYEDNELGTANYKLRMPAADSPQITRPGGTKTEIRAPEGTKFAPNTPVAYISSALGSIAMVQEEY